MRATRFLALALGFCPLLAGASAQAYNGWDQPSSSNSNYYAEFDMAAAINSDSDVTGMKNGAGTELSSKIDFDSAANFSGALGYNFGFMRVDGEIGYQQADIDKIHLNNANYAGHGDISVATFMGSAYYDFPVEGSLKPFIGAGGGLAHLSMDASNASQAFNSSDDDTVFAYHFTAGTGYQINNQLSLLLSYRYFQTTDASFKGSSDVTGVSDNAKFDFGSQQLRFGLRLGF